MVMERVFRPRWMMSVTPLWGVMLSMIISFHVLTILLMPLELFGGPWECQEVNGGDLDISLPDAQYKSNHTKVVITALITVK